MDNQIADIAYLKKELLNIGIMPSQVDQEDMVDLLEVFATLEQMMHSS